MNRNTISAIKTANEASGGHWFEPGALQFFASKVEEQPVIPTKDGGALFLSSEQFVACDGERFPRKFTIRKCEPDGSIFTEGDFQAYGNKEAAVTAMGALASKEG